MAYQTATNPDTGERLILINDAWQKIEKSATNEAGEKAYLVKGIWLTPEVKPTTTQAGEGMPQERSTMQEIMQAPAGIYRGFKDVTDTLIKGGASAVDYQIGRAHV